jgi:opacity protein-like surface antigen
MQISRALLSSWDMQKKIILLLALSLSIFNLSAHAQDTNPETSATVGESWYWTFGLGYSMPSYPSVISTQLDSLKASGFSRTPLALDLGFYWPIADQKLIIGPSIHGSSDVYSKGTSDFRFTQTGLYFSAMYTVGKEPGSGLIFRGDVGLASLSVSANGNGTSVSANSNSGIGLNAGVGYGINVSEGTRLILLGVYSYRHIEGENYGDFTITVGPVF